jgi:hypothetical protein
MLLQVLLLLNQRLRRLRHRHLRHRHRQKLHPQQIKLLLRAFSKEKFLPRQL